VVAGRRASARRSDPSSRAPVAAAISRVYCGGEARMPNPRIVAPGGGAGDGRHPVSPPALHVRSAIVSRVIAPLAPLQAKLAETSQHRRPQALHVREAIGAVHPSSSPATARRVPEVFQLKPASRPPPGSRLLLPLRQKVLQPFGGPAASVTPAATAAPVTPAAAATSAAATSAAAAPAPVAEAKAVGNVLSASQLEASFLAQYQLWIAKKVRVSFSKKFNTSHAGSADSTSAQVSQADFATAVGKLRAMKFLTPDGTPAAGFNYAASASMRAQGVWDIIVSEDVNGGAGPGMNYHIKVI
jgi:hypothetical protein